MQHKIWIKHILMHSRLTESKGNHREKMERKKELKLVEKGNRKLT